MKRFVVALVALLAIFTFIRDFSGSISAQTPPQGQQRVEESRAELIP